MISLLVNQPKKETQWNGVDHENEDGDNSDNSSDQNNEETCTRYKQTLI